MYDQLQAESVLQSMPLLLYWALSYAGLSTAKKKFQDKIFHKFQDTRKVVGRSHVQIRVDNGYMYGPRISKL